MKITKIELYPVGTRRETLSLSPHIIITMTTDEGHVGIGEMSDLGHNPISPDVDRLDYLLNERLKGVDPFDPERIDPVVDALESPLGAGIDVVIHDLRAKILGVPVHDLYGGAYRDRYKICYPIFRQFDASEIDPNIDRVTRMLALGFDLFRVYVGGNVDVDERFFQRRHLHQLLRQSVTGGWCATQPGSTLRHLSGGAGVSCQDRQRFLAIVGKTPMLTFLQLVGQFDHSVLVLELTYSGLVASVLLSWTI